MTLDPELCEHDIPAAVSQLDLGGKPVSLYAQFRGGQCRVYKLSLVSDTSYQNRKSIAVRVPVHMKPGPGVVCVLQTEWKTLQKLQEKAFTWSPIPLVCSLTFDNPIKHPFLVLIWGEGSKARWNDHLPPRPLQDRFVSQMASIQMCLLECTSEVGTLKSPLPVSDTSTEVIREPDMTTNV